MQSLPYDFLSHKTYGTPYVGRYVIMEHPTSMKMGTHISLKNTLCTHVSGYVILEHSILYRRLCHYGTPYVDVYWVYHYGTPFVGGYVIVGHPI